MNNEEYEGMSQSNEVMRAALIAIRSGTTAMTRFINDYDVADDEELGKSFNNSTLISMIVDFALDDVE